MEPGLEQEVWAAVVGTRLPWKPGLERTQLLIGLVVEIQVTSAAEVRWTGDSEAAVLEERAVAVEVHLSVEAEMPEAGVVHLGEEAVAETVVQAEVQAEFSLSEAELVEAKASVVMG